MLVPLAPSVMPERHRATLAVQLGLMEDKGRLLVLVVKPENILLLEALFVNSATAGSGATLQQRCVLIVPLVVTPLV